MILNFRQSKLVCAINAAVNVYSKFLQYLDRLFTFVESYMSHYMAVKCNALLLRKQS